MEADTQVRGGKELGVVGCREPGRFYGHHFEFIGGLQLFDLGEVVCFERAFAGDYSEDFGKVRVSGD